MGLRGLQDGAYAALMVAISVSTSRLSRSDWRVRSSEADSTWVAALPVSLAARVTSPMLRLTSVVPWAASWTLWAISPVAAAC